MGHDFMNCGRLRYPMRPLLLKTWSAPMGGCESAQAAAAMVLPMSSVSWGSEK
ncbi:hypothetical protein RSAG8_03202, partial [Rhizoctonia solani AG-8 WAC10335]